MAGETDLKKLIKTMKPQLVPGDYVFCPVDNIDNIYVNKIICLFKELEGYTIILEKGEAHSMGLRYTSEFAWITLTVHSSLEAIGLTAAFSGALADAGISCNVVAAYYHDHIFVGKSDTRKAMEVLNKLSG